ncbi:MAG: nucleoside recognition domain-containing protein [Alphaproteobacteria bacterium]
MIIKIKDILSRATTTSWELFKILIPALIAVKICQELDLIKYLAIPLEPVMGLVGLPAEMGLAWAMAIANSMYAGIAVFFTLAQDIDLTIAQVTVLGVMILIAHTFPAEIQIAGKAGARRRFQILFRLGSAILLGAILNLLYGYFNYLQEPATILFVPDSAPETYTAWAIANIKSLFYIYVIILTLITVMEVLEKLGVIKIMNKILAPLMRFLGISEKAIPLTIAGLTMGISYGGGLIIQEAKKGTLSSREVFYALSFLAVFHSLIEDTLLIVAIGGHLSGILWARLAFTVIIIMLLVGVVKRLPDRFCERFLWKRTH